MLKNKDLIIYLDNVDYLIENDKAYFIEILN